MAEQLAQLCVWIVALPLAASVAAFAAGRRAGPGIGVGTALSLTVLTHLAGVGLFRHGPLRYALGDWTPPLGIGWRLDGLSALMLMATAIVGTGISMYAVGYFAPRAAAAPKQQGSVKQQFFWPLWLFAWGGLNVLFLSADAFNIYVALEIVSFSAITLVALSGTVAALKAATRYFFLTLTGSLMYLLGVGLIYSAYGMLDLDLLAQTAQPGTVNAAALSLMTVGLIIKAALFPMHFWLPPAHANAPAPVSAVLSGLVVMASFYLLVRLWLDTFSAVLSPLAGHLPGILGTAAIVTGSMLAMRQQRLKMMLAYSTVAQVGYMFMIFPLFGGSPAAKGFAWNGGIYLSVAHACAKSAAFLAAGAVIYALGHDRIKDLGGLARRFPLMAFAIALAGVSLIGLPPSGGFTGKWMLLKAAMISGQWGYAVVLIVGSLLSAIYIFRVLEVFMRPPAEDAAELRAPAWLTVTALAMAVGGIVLGLGADIPADLLRIGDPLDLSEVRGYLL